ncbi:tryptophan--tRNA ligase [bacterium]|nr:tryptophan--tRNA ligase [bacterium]
MSTGQKILVTGIKPTGRPHLGNYFGMMRQVVEMQEKPARAEGYESYIFVADLHALTTLRTPHNSQELSANIRDIVLDYLAVGVDPKKVTLYLQSDIPEIAELGWIFNCITTMPFLSRAHAYKDAQAKGREVSVGTFDYPMLMAADILIQDADMVPVGQDQKQHVEITRDTAEKFNLTFGDTFKLPNPLILDDVKLVPGTDGKKMSKSYGNTIPLFATDEEIKKAVMSIPTDSKGVEEPKNTETDTVFALHKLFATPNTLSEIERKYKEGGLGYKESKEMLIENITRFIAPLRERRKEFEAQGNLVGNILKEGGEVARARAIKKLEEVREKIGLYA